MLTPLSAARLITPPAIWGKLPAHLDFAQPIEGDLASLEEGVEALWKRHAPTWFDLWRPGHRSRDDAMPRPTVLEEIARLEMAHEPARGLRGVKCLPWADWPQGLQQREPSAFWQQDSEAGFDDAAHRLDKLWSATR